MSLQKVATFSEWQRRERTGACHGLVTFLSRHQAVIGEVTKEEQPLPIATGSSPCPPLHALSF